MKQEPLSEPSNGQGKALLAALLSYMCWGFFPIYWKLLANVPSPEILAHRMVWACLFYISIYSFNTIIKGQLSTLFKQTLKQWSMAVLAAGILAVNWGIYIYAVKSGQIVQGSLAYFINPLLNVAVGVFLFKEEFPWILRIACLFAGIGVLIQVAFASVFPWIALSLAVSFCSYGIVKKTLKISPDLSSAMEGLVSFLPALFFVVYFRNISSSEITAAEWALLVGSGVVTGLPLLLFSTAAQLLPYSLLGMMQFIAPTLQFIVGTVLYGERLDSAGIMSFTLIWLGAAFYFWFQLHAVFQRRPR